ncbi:hypothetical protein B9Z55_016444 [Caenorhabditis nigoni]|uniref:Secreted protein n=1 Tax=Caenorhabditis nigoni TaxID=1611254 RepID=A0A2G5T4K8_9PELO|nr:hypothetical protein B9Z55_016444 [Caenorhabditis nigoni]
MGSFADLMMPLTTRCFVLLCQFFGDTCCVINTGRSLLLCCVQDNIRFPDSLFLYDGCIWITVDCILEGTKSRSCGRRGACDRVPKSQLP